MEEYLEPADADDTGSLEVLDEGELPAPETSILADPALGSIARSFGQLLIPLAILDSNLYLVYRNRAFDGLLSRFVYEGRSSFPGIFSQAMGQEEVKDLLAALRSPERRYSWRGEIRHKARHASTEITKAIIFPWIVPESGNLLPKAYTVLFDDVTEENQRMLSSMFMALLEASRKKDLDTGEHVKRVNMYSSLLASRLYDDPAFPEVDRDFIVDIGVLAAMHDVGKIGTPDDIIHKPGPLSPWEWSIMREHTLNGAYILATYPNPMARDIARSHHEMWDGNGYPYKLEGEYIPLSARIVSIADVYDALRSKRPYKAGYSHEVSVEKIREWRGSHFDPRLVDAFLDLESEFAGIYRGNSPESA